MSEALDQLRRVKVVAVIRAPSRGLLEPTVRALLAGGVRGIEVTLSTPNAIEGIRELAEWMPPDALLGVGTVLQPSEAVDAVAAGAKFVVSPVTHEKVIHATKETGALSLPGAYTPTEVYGAWQMGADVVKVFPAGSLGPDYLRSLLAPLPFLRLMPTGGVEAENLPAWIQAGAWAVGTGSSLVSSALIGQQDWPEIERRARVFSQAAKLL